MDINGKLLFSDPDDVVMTSVTKESNWSSMQMVDGSLEACQAGRFRVLMTFQGFFSRNLLIRSSYLTLRENKEHLTFCLTT